jgi:hypothetical protein
MARKATLPLSFTRPTSHAPTCALLQFNSLPAPGDAGIRRCSKESHLGVRGPHFKDFFNCLFALTSLTQHHTHAKSRHYRFLTQNGIYLTQ